MIEVHELGIIGDAKIKFDGDYVRDQLVDQNTALEPLKAYLKVTLNNDGTASVTAQDVDGHTLLVGKDEVTYKIKLDSIITNTNLDIINSSPSTIDEEILKAINKANKDSLQIKELHLIHTNVVGVVKVAANEDSKIYGGTPVEINYKIDLSSIIKKNDTLGLIVNDKNEAVKPDVPTIKRMLSKKYKDVLDVDSIDVVISTKNGFAVITPKDNTNYVKSANIDFKVAIGLYIPDNAIKEPIKGFKTNDELKAIFQAQLDAGKVSVDLSQTEIIKNENGELTFRVLKDSKLYDSTDKYNVFKISYKYVASSLFKDKEDLGIFDRFPDKSDIKNRILKDLKIQGINLDEFDFPIKDDGTVTFTIKDDSSIYVPENPIVAHFKVKLTDKVNDLGLLRLFTTDKGKIFAKIMETNSEM